MEGLFIRLLKIYKNPGLKIQVLFYDNHFFRCCKVFSL
jgi:hypothetical protein